MKVFNQQVLFQLALLGILLIFLGLFWPVGSINYSAAFVIGLVVSFVREWAGGWKPVALSESVMWCAVGAVLLAAESFTNGARVFNGEPGKASFMGVAFIGVGVSILLIHKLSKNQE